MNRLLHKSPSFVLIDGVEYEINTDFRDCMFTVEQLKNPELTPEEKALILINNMYLEDPPNVEEAIRQAVWFLRCGEERESREQKQIYDFEQDSGFIDAAFLKAGVDLDAVETMHWWKFMARFSELPESAYTRVLYLRSRMNEGNITKDERKQAERIGWDVINIKKPLSAEERALQQMFEDSVEYIS